MSPPLVLGFCALLTAFVGLSARLCVECDPLDVILMSATCVAIGYMLPLL